MADNLPFRAPKRKRLAWHPPCSLTHHLRIPGLPKSLLEEAGFVVLEAPESHLCCGAGGANAVLEPQLAETLRSRKLDHLQLPGADAIVSANFGCIRHLAAESRLPVLHYAQLLAWAAGAPDPFLSPPRQPAARIPAGSTCTGGTCGCGT